MSQNSVQRTVKYCLKRIKPRKLLLARLTL